MNKIYIMGDTHGSCKPVRALHLRNNTNKIYYEAEKTLIILGDFGANFFFNERDDEYKRQLGEYPFTYFIIRGNHEERPSICMDKYPERWHVELYFDNIVYVENNYPYIKYALDTPAVYDIDGYKTLIIPGAYSPDKWHRLKEHWSWFPHEQLDEKEREEGKQLIIKYNSKVDLVLTHTSPKIYEPTDLFLPIVDQSTVDDTMERYLGEIEQNLNYKLWCFGHFHATRIYPQYEDKQTLMLFQERAIELHDWMENLPENIGKFV